MTSWKIYRLGDICSRLRSGKGIPASEVSACGKFAVVGGNGVRGYTDKSNFKGQCVVVGRQGAYCGNVRYFDGEFYMTEHAVVIVGNEYADTHFLAYLLSTMHLGQLSAQSAQPGLSVQTLSKLEIALPPLEEQRRIARILGAIDDKIENNRRINTNLELQAQALFEELICDENLKYEYIANLEHIIETGRRPKGGVANIVNGVPSIGAENIKGLGKYDYSKTKYITAGFAQSLKKGFVKGYELLIYKDGGKPGYFIPNFSIFGEGFPYDKMALNEHVFLLDFGNKGYNFFAYFFFQTEEVMRYLNAQGSKAAIPGINRNDVESIAIPTIENETVKEFCKRVEPIITAILTNAKESSRLATLRDTLLPKLMNGEIKL